MNSKTIFFLCLQIYLCVSEEGRPCISTYQELKFSLRSNLTDNVQKMLDVFYPPNEAATHVVFVRYCVRNNFTVDAEIDQFVEEECNVSFATNEFQWLTNSVPLLIDSDVFQGNTFSFADLNHQNLSVTIDPFCDGVNGMTMLETLTVWLKSYALGDEDTVEGYSTILSTDNENETLTGYIELFNVNGSAALFGNMRLLQNAKKFLIGLWLGTTSITLALILHVGRCSMKTANAVNQILQDLTEIMKKLISIPTAVVGAVQGATQKKAEEGKPKKEEGSKDMNGVVDNGSVKMLKTEKQDGARDQTKSDDIELVTHGKTGHSNTLPKAETTLTDGARDQTEIELVTHGKTGHSNTLPKAETTLNENSLEELSEIEKQTNTSIQSSAILDSLRKQAKKFKHRDAAHPFAYFTKTFQKFFTTSVLLVLGFLGYDIYIYVMRARRLSYDWFILFPFPFWFSLVAIINFFAFILTESVLYCRVKKEIKRQRSLKMPQKSCIGKACKLLTNFVITMSATTIPVFVLFHVFWLVIASSTFAIRIASSVTFYVPLAIFVLWFLSVASSILEAWKKVITKMASRKNKGVNCKIVLHFIHLFLRPLTPCLFLPFWVLLLATLQFFSDFLLNVVDLENQSLLVIFGIIIVIVGTTLKIAKSCRPTLEEDEPEDEDTITNTVFVN